MSKMISNLFFLLIFLLMNNQLISMNSKLLNDIFDVQLAEQEILKKNRSELFNYLKKLPRNNLNRLFNEMDLQVSWYIIQNLGDASLQEILHKLDQKIYSDFERKLENDIEEDDKVVQEMLKTEKREKRNKKRVRNQDNNNKSKPVTTNNENKIKSALSNNKRNFLTVIGFFGVCVISYLGYKLFVKLNSLEEQES